MSTPWPRDVNWDFILFADWLRHNYQELSDADYAKAVRRHDYLEVQAKANGIDVMEIR